MVKITAEVYLFNRLTTKLNYCTPPSTTPKNNYLSDSVDVLKFSVSGMTIRILPLTTELVTKTLRYSLQRKHKVLLEYSVSHYARSNLTYQLSFCPI